MMVRSLIKRTKNQALTARLRKTERPTPNMIMVDETKPGLMEGRNLLSQLSNKQRLQIKATRMKNNKFCISWYAAKLRYFANNLT